MNEEWKQNKLKAESRRPLRKMYFPLGPGKGIQLTVWPTNIQMQRQERDDNGKWSVTQEIALARTVLERLFIRMPKIFELMKEEYSKEQRLETQQTT